MKKILLLTAALCAAMTSMAEVTLYYVNSGNWSSVNAYVWPTGGDSSIAGWPGEEATPTGETAKGFDVYSYTFDETLADNVIFNGDGGQTGDMSFDASKPYCYGEEWYASIAEIEGAGDIATYDYYIAGNGSAGSDWCCGKGWNPSGCGLENNTITFSSLPAGEYQFKITNGTWDFTLGYAELTDQTGFTTIEEGDGANNIIFTLEESKSVTISTDGVSVTVTFGAATEEPEEEPTAIDEVDAEDAVVAAFDITGKPVAADAAGIVILQYASGKAVKVFNN